MDLKQISYRHETVLHKDHSCMVLAIKRNIDYDEVQKSFKTIEDNYLQPQRQQSRHK